MPNKPTRYCGVPNCPNKAEPGHRYCVDHKDDMVGWRTKERRRQQDRDRGTSAERGYNYKWQKTREKFLKQHPLCHDCETKGYYRPAEEVHHIVKLADGGSPYGWHNLMPLCKSCHSKRTAKGE